MDNICDLADQTVDNDSFQDLKPTDLPKAIIGCIIKNKYDESRVQIQEEYTPKNILHFISVDGEIEPIYIHGVVLDELPLLHTICEDIKMAPLLSHSLLESYDCIMRRNKLSCESCYRYLADGLYPIDIKHLHRFSIKKYTDLHKMTKKGEALPWFSYWVHVGLFILNPPTMVQQAI